MRRRPLQRNGKAGVQPPDLGQRRPVAAPDLGHPRPFEDRVEHHGVLFRRPVAAHAAVGYLSGPAALHAGRRPFAARHAAGRHTDSHRRIAAQAGRQQPHQQRREIHGRRQHHLRLPLPAGCEQVELFVHDTGKGIAQEHLDRIFERFYKADSFVKGVGLGLSICRTITEYLGGAISVESNPAKAPGSRFSTR
ncbi:MAG: ATP-binding protein [Alistipes finegoldii]